MASSKSSSRTPKTVVVKEGNALLRCECPTDDCDNCKLKFKCYTERPLDGDTLTLREKMEFVRRRPILLE